MAGIWNFRTNAFEFIHRSFIVPYKKALTNTNGVFYFESFSTRKIRRGNVGVPAGDFKRTDVYICQLYRHRNADALESLSGGTRGHSPNFSEQLPREEIVDIAHDRGSTKNVQVIQR